VSTPRISRGSLAIATLSTVVEWYDFTLYLYLATVLSRVFFGPGAASVALTLAGFAVAYAARPVGALVFGRIGDRHGRRAAMLLSMALMTAAMLLTAALPTYAQVGTAAGWLLLLLRCVTAFAVGGEYTGVVAYLLEGAPPHRRGLVTSIAAATSEIGGLLAVGIAAVTVASLTPAALASWGWRVPFLIGGGLAMAIGLARSFMQESPEFERQRAAGTVPERPMRDLLARHRLAVLRGFAISALGSITYYVGITYVPAFLVAAGTMEEAASLRLGTVAALVVIVVTPLTGMLADRVGRRPVLVALALSGAILPLLLFRIMVGQGGLAALAGAMMLAALGGAVSAVGAVATAEQFPGEGRLTGLALGATTATAIFGGLAPLIAHLLTDATGWPAVPGAMIALVALAVLPVMVRLPDTGVAGTKRDPGSSPG